MSVAATRSEDWGGFHDQINANTKRFYGIEAR